MAPPIQLQKAFLETETGTQINCMFNPNKFSFSTSNRWESDSVPGLAAPTMRYAGGDAGRFNLSLVFDTTADGTAVTTYTNTLLALMKVDTSLPGYDAARNNGRPPWVKFHWGTQIHTYKAIIKSLDIGFTYFSSDGTPLRANVELSLEQFEPDDVWAKQNPTSGTPHPNRTHQVRVGDTLDRVAAKYYGDSTKWRDIADANGIRDPLAIRPGQLLAIPERAG
jgi:hypothetical protein